MTRTDKSTAPCAIAVLALAVGAFICDRPASADKYVFDGHICQPSAFAQDLGWFAVDSDASDTSLDGGGLLLSDEVEAVCPLPTNSVFQTNTMDQVNLYFRMEAPGTVEDGEVVETALYLHDLDGDYDQCMSSNHTVDYDASGVESWTTTLYRATSPGDCDSGAATNEWTPAIRVYSGNVHGNFDELRLRGIRVI